MAQAVLSVGDDSMLDAVNLLDFGNTACQCWLMGGVEAVKMPPPQVRRYHSRSKGNATQVEKTRTVTLQLHIQSDTASDFVWGKVHALRKKFRQARRSYGAGTARLGTGVCYRYQPHQNAPATYVDVLDGEITDIKQDFSASWILEVTVTLVCLPYLRGRAVTLATSGTITNAAGNPYYIPNVPGDDEALCQIQLVDTSPSGAINRVRLARRSLDGLGASDFTAILIATAATGATHHTGDAPSVGGSNYSVIPDYSWRDVALYSPPAPLFQTHGDLDVLVRLRDHTAFVEPPFNLTATGSSAAGSLSSANNYTYFISIATTDALGHASEFSEEVAYVLRSGETEIVVNWTETSPAANISGHIWQMRYGGYGFNTTTNTWAFLPVGISNGTTGSTSASYTIAALGTGASITLSNFAPVELQLGVAVGLPGASLEDSQYNWGDPFTAQVGGGNYEARLAGPFRCPPGPWQEGQPLQSYQFKLKAQTQPGAVVGAALDSDAIILLPHDERQAVLEYPGMGSATKYTWLIDTDRSGYPSAYLSSSGSVVRAVSAEGEFYLGPGGNLLVVVVEGIAGIHDITSTYTLTVTYAPRYSDPIAAGW